MTSSFEASTKLKNTTDLLTESDLVKFNKPRTPCNEETGALKDEIDPNHNTRNVGEIKVDSTTESTIPNLNRQRSKNVRFHIVSHDSPDRDDMIEDFIMNHQMDQNQFNRSISNASIKNSSSLRVTANEIPTSFLRSDSIIIRVKPGQRFTDLADVIVEPAAASDPKLGTLGELRHHLRTGTKHQV